MKVQILDSMLGTTMYKFDQNLETLKFYSTCGHIFRFMHHQDCCENVEIVDIEGDLNTLLNSPILQAEVVTREATSKETSESGTWTFYKFATIKGSVTVRWLGESNGYYSEDVSLDILKNTDISKFPENHL